MLVVAGLALQAALAGPLAAQDGAPGKDAAALPPGTLAIVNGVAIQQARLDEALRASHQPDTPGNRETLKQDLIAREVLRQHAERQGYDSKPEVKQAVNSARAAAEAELYLRDHIHLGQVTESQVKARYDEVIGMMGEQEYKVHILSVADDHTAQTVLGKLREGASFEALVREYSIAASKEDGGEMPWVTFKLPAVEGKTQGVPLPIAQAISHLQVGAVTAEPVVVGSVRVIIRLDARRATQVPPFDEMRTSIRQQLQILAINKARADIVGDLVQHASIRQ